MLTLLKRLFTGKLKGDLHEAEELRIAFKARYHSFKLLLAANRRVLETMAEVDKALRGEKPFGITYVRALCTRIATDVWRIVKELDDLAPGKYARLKDRFKAINDGIAPFIAPRRPPAPGPLVLRLSDLTEEQAGQAGNKMSRLGEAANKLGVRIPAGFVVTDSGYRRFMEHNDLLAEIGRRLQLSGGAHVFDLCEGIQQLVTEAEIPEELEQAILGEYEALQARAGSSAAVAVRSSALREDVAGATFAGQFMTELNVDEESVLAAYKAVVASKYSAAAMSYRHRMGVRDDQIAMCVGILTMIDAVAGGALYSRNPIEADDHSIIISSARGLPMLVTDGRAPADLFVVSRGDPPRITKHGAGSQSLNDEQILELAALALRLEEHHGTAQDIEWAVDEQGRVVLLQSRPLQITRRAKRESEIPASVEQKAKVILKGGVTAAPGAAAGPVAIVRDDEAARDFPEDAILVTVEALPHWAALLSRAAAIVCERGSVAGHLASVAREFDIPALFGIEGAVDSLAAGRLVTVDADGQAVYSGRVAASGRLPEKPMAILPGSPVHRALSGAARFITPLNLLDPDSHDFRPGACKTFHDITRFCHEKATHEMFSFGRDHHFPERSSKRLYCDVPMQWWVLNLDDGFKEEVSGKYVKMSNIVSTPMLALWDGIMAVAWEGPPPVDGKGFLSVMFQAATDSALAPSVRSRYQDRNYFMISRNYCCLKSRLGAHFSIVEAMVSERVGENYISFQFKGGAADFDRRLRRVIFVKDILEEYGFHVQRTEDKVHARLEGREHGYMLERLKILGYLTLHTRQLDMVMSNPAAVNYYRNKIHQDINSII
jgi:pyruvate,water dikinase